jgi:hypothetical protein
MKKPQKIIKWLFVDRKLREPFVDHNGKPLYTYFIELPYWIVKAYNPFQVKVEISNDHLSYAERVSEENREETEKYVKENWSKKLDKMRKVNNNYMLVSTVAVSKEGFKSMEDYENYHRELQELNRRYLQSISPSRIKEESVNNG